MNNECGSAVEKAVELARDGFLIFPLRPDSKEPYGESWTDIMTSDEDTIRGWFDYREGMNYGVCPGEKYVIVDLDPKEDKDGVEAFGMLEIEHGEIDTYRVRTRSGGQHLYMQVDRPASNAHSFPDGIDVRGAHGYVVGPGSSVDGKIYTVISDIEPAKAPDWIVTRLKKYVVKNTEDRETLLDLDQPESISRALNFLRHRDPAIEGLEGDKHTLLTAMGIIDYGLSEEKTLEILTKPFTKTGETEPLSWNERCVPPWDITGRQGTLEEKVRNAWRYRERDVGSKGSGAMFDISDVQDIKNIAELNEQEGSEGRFARIKSHMFRGESMFNRGRRREFIIPEWLPAHGITASLARRGGGKTVVMIDLALRVACDMEWHGSPIKENFYSVYICGEDDEGAEEQVRAWCHLNGREHPPERFIFLDIITDLMSPEDTREWAEALRDTIGPEGRAVTFVDTWQRASARGGQNKDEDMQLAVGHAEALARSLSGPAVIAFHPPKHDDRMVMGSSVIENSTVAIWSMTDAGTGRRLEVTRIKGKGIGNYKMFKFEEVLLGETDEFGNERTGVVPVKTGGVADGAEVDEGRYEARKVLANVLREFEMRRKDTDPNSTKHYAISKVAKLISESLPELEEIGDDWAIEMLNNIRESGSIAISSWKNVRDRITELLAKDPGGYDFGDGYALRFYRDGVSQRFRIEKSGITS